MYLYVSSEANGWGTSPTMEAHVVFWILIHFQVIPGSSIRQRKASWNVLDVFVNRHVFLGVPSTSTKTHTASPSRKLLNIFLGLRGQPGQPGQHGQPISLRTNPISIGKPPNCSMVHHGSLRFHQGTVLTSLGMGKVSCSVAKMSTSGTTW